MSARVASASETMACERATIEAGISGRELMRRAGEAAAAEIVARHPPERPRQAAVFTGPGNNGGDGWVVAGALARAGYEVRVIEAAPLATPDAIHAREVAIASISGVRPAPHSDSVMSPSSPPAPRPVSYSDSGLPASSPSAGRVIVSTEPGSAALVVDALLGTGASGEPRGNIASAISAIDDARERGAHVVALDLPSGLDATTGLHSSAVRADLTLAFGTLKRGLLLARDIAGEIIVLDIGLIESAVLRSLPVLVDGDWASSRIPAIAWNSHKGTRKRVTVIGGGSGMAGAAILAGRGALRSGVGLLRLVVGRENIGATHAAVPEALVSEWPGDAESVAAITLSADVIAIGPGLGRSAATRALVETVLLAWTGPVVLDADALNVFEDDSESLVVLLRGRPAIITPHPAELARLLGSATEDVLADRFEAGATLSARLGAAVLLKGNPTVVFAPNGDRYVCATGTAALATGGSGDVLTGITATLLAQALGVQAAEAASCAAFTHGRASELCGTVRGTTLADIIRALPAAWNESDAPRRRGILATLEGPI